MGKSLGFRGPGKPNKAQIAWNLSGGHKSLRLSGPKNTASPFGGCASMTGDIWGSLRSKSAGVLVLWRLWTLAMRNSPGQFECLKQHAASFGSRLLLNSALFPSFLVST